ncbi:SET domain-containing protein [Tothia fuscella]|uniref:SET domain-containing protein n=1 Tax=Tothia fuscella TaxID=1048955 RepID=A0A9P4NDK1_9PEZI|nr:SET domain-containing protein [Tothia fuscella]
MGIDAGFDMVPRLSTGGVDIHNWGRFIESLKEHYKDDTQVEIKPNYINFKAGEHPQLPFEGHKFLHSYIDTVTRIAQAHFASRIRCWHESFDEFGTYDWNEVNESRKSYEQPDEFETPTSIAQLLTGTDPIKELGITPFEIKDIPGKGKGLVACFNISSGTRILCEKPLLIVRGARSREELETFLVAKLKAMSKSSQRQFLSLHTNSPGKYPFSGIFKTNALPCGAGSPIGAVYPTACFINHSCIPNAHNSWNSNEEHETIDAIRPIKSGEEITIPYDHGGFGCTLPPSLLQASDNRRTQIQTLDEAIGDPSRIMSSPYKSLRDCYTLLEVLEQEFDGYAGALIARLYYDAFQISIAHGDQARASMFAERARKARVICEGEDSPETLRVKSLALKPAGHRSFEAYSRKWRTTRDSVPEGLDTVQFNSWLFRQES